MSKKQETPKTSTETSATEMNTEMNKQLQQWMRLPLQVGEMMMKNAQATQQASLDYFSSVEKIQRETTKNMSELWNTMVPGENKLWKSQVDMMEKSFNMAERMMNPKA